jgi:hypothetical protein
MVVDNQARRTLDAPRAPNFFREPDFRDVREPAFLWRVLPLSKSIMPPGQVQREYRRMPLPLCVSFRHVSWPPMGAEDGLVGAHESPLRDVRLPSDQSAGIMMP